MYPKTDIIEITKLLLIRGRFSLVFNEICRRLHSNRLQYGLRCDLTKAFQAPQARIHIRIRPFRNSDMPMLFAFKDQTMGDEEVMDRIRRLRMLKSGIQKCYVAVTENEVPCYIQWLIGPKENEKVQQFFNGGFPLLAHNEMLLEFAFTHEAYRGLRIMPSAMAKIAEKGADFGASSIMTFVDSSNTPSLKGSKRAGFVPFMTRRDKWRFFQRKVTFEGLPEGTPYPFDKS